MLPNPQETTDLVTFTEEIFNRTLHFLRNDDASGEVDSNEGGWVVYLYKEGGLSI